MKLIEYFLFVYLIFITTGVALRVNRELKMSFFWIVLGALLDKAAINNNKFTTDTVEILRIAGLVRFVLDRSGIWGLLRRVLLLLQLTFQLFEHLALIAILLPYAFCLFYR